MADSIIDMVGALAALVLAGTAISIIAWVMRP